jgi:hypothetical protein
MGFNVISCSADIFVYGQALAQHVSTVRAALPAAS